MRISSERNTRTSRMRTAITLCAAILFVPIVVLGQDLGEPFVGAEILPETVQLEHNSGTACVLKTAGDVFCWANSPFGFLNELQADEAGFSALNAELNNDISSITLGDRHLCAIGREAGVACFNFDFGPFILDPGLDMPPEPDASYLSISDITTSDLNVCGIQTDNRVVCWGFVETINAVPPEAAFLQQVDVLSGRACGIDLNNEVVCWGTPTTLAAGGDLQFGDVDISSIGPARQIALGPFGACIIDTNDGLTCFGDLSLYTDFFAGQTFSDISVRSTSGPVLCFETTSGEKDCESINFSTGTPFSESRLPPGTDARLISFVNAPCYITTDQVMECIFSGNTPTNQFPTAPENLTLAIFSPTEGEGSWTRPSESPFSSDFATGYEVFRDGVLIDRLPVVTSFFDGDTNADASYELRATRGLIAGASAFINADGSSGSGLPASPATPSAPTSPVAPTTPIAGTNDLALTGEVYSATALELFYNRDPNPNVRYNIFRDGVLIRENSPATSQFESSLDANTSYFYEVVAVLDGDTIASSSITLTTLGGSGAAAPAQPTAPPVPPATPSGISVTLSAEVYSSTSLELFWNRAAVSGVTYDVFRDGVLIRDNTPAVSQFEGSVPSNGTFSYVVEALFNGSVVASDSINVNTATGDVSTSAAGAQPPTSGPQPASVAPIELTGVVFSSTALEISWNRDAIPGVTYDIFRDGELIRADSPAVSQFESGLIPNTEYVYLVIPQLNGVEQPSDTVVLSTRSL